MRRNVIISADGSATMYMEDIGEHYHSVSGALEESVHIFINNGLKRIYNDSVSSRKEINILEMGFGTGLNTLLTICHIVNDSSDSIIAPRVNYTAVEKYPLTPEEYHLLNHSEVLFKSALFPNLSENKIKSIQESMISAKWNEISEIIPGFYLNKIGEDFTQFSGITGVDLVYYDAFSPNVQPELWSREIFERVAQMCSPGAILVTYSSKGSVKEALRSSGFFVKRFKGINGKRHNISAQLPL